MLQQILKDMYIDPDVLEALNEDQKKTLFLKMRQEQVRRWTEREGKGQPDGRGAPEAPAARPKTANRKRVSWLLGRDGDVAVTVIGDADERRSPRLISSDPEEAGRPYCQKAPPKSSLASTSSADSGKSARGRETPTPKPPTGIHLNLKGNAEEVGRLPPLQDAATEQQPSLAVDNPPDAGEASRGAAPEASKPSVTFYRPHIRVAPATQRHVEVASPPPASVATAATPASASNPAPSASGSWASALAPSLPPPASSAPAPARTSAPAPASPPTAAPVPSPALTLSAAFAASGSAAGKDLAPPSSRLRLQDPAAAAPPPSSQDAQANRDIRVVAASRRPLPQEEEEEEAGTEGGKGVAGRGRVAQLMKTFSVAGATAAPRGTKPPLPSKPSHLRLTASPSLR